MAKYFKWVGGIVRLQPDVDVALLQKQLASADTWNTEHQSPVKIWGVDAENPLGNVWLTVHPWALDWYFILDSPDDGEGAPEPS